MTDLKSVGESREGSTPSKATTLVDAVSRSNGRMVEWQTRIAQAYVRKSGGSSPSAATTSLERMF